MAMAEAEATMQGKVCLITGATSGIGKATALGLARAGANVVLVARNAEQGEAVRTEIRQHSGNEAIELFIADLSSQAAIRQLASDFLAHHQTLHVLINNAGIMMGQRTVTIDGIETMLAVNYLAPFLLTNLLLDTIKASAPARIINVASVPANMRINFDDLQATRKYSGFRQYQHTKLALVLFTYELARRLQGNGVTVNCLHPGTVNTNILRNPPPLIGFLAKVPLAPLFFSSPEKGAETSLYLATAPEVEQVTGKYFIKKKEARSAKESYDEQVAQRLWLVGEKMTQLSDQKITGKI
jgi:NAD(P)-dependent dehydrogenase (short-subunit alcohol dehydrogenase family)